MRKPGGMESAEFRDVLQATLTEVSQRLIGGWLKPTAKQLEGLRDLMAEYRKLETAPGEAAVAKLREKLTEIEERLRQIEDVNNLRRQPARRDPGIPRIA